MMPTSDPLVSKDQGGARGGYQSIEGAGGLSSHGTEVHDQKTFLSQIKEVKENSQGCCEFCSMFFGVLLGSIVWFLVLIVTFSLPLVMIILGAMYFHDCPHEPMIPIFNLVAGCVIMANNITNMVVRVKRFSDPQMPKRPTVVGWVTTILNIFLLGWFIAGCYWVYGAYEKDSKDLRCNVTLYSFSFWLLNASFIFFFSMVIAASVMMCLALLCF